MAVVLIIQSVIITSCSSAVSEKVEAGKDASATAENKSTTVENKNAEPKEMPKTAQNKKNDDLPSLKIEDDYKTGVRVKMLEAGWVPARSEEGNQNCVSGMKICEEYPELEAGPAAGMGNIVFRWKKGDQVLLIHTVDDPPMYSQHEFEKSAKQSSKPHVTGKYKLSEIGLSGDYTLELKNNQTAMLKILEEDGTSTGTGSWSWDSTKELLTVKLRVKYEAAGSEVTGKKPEASEVLFQFTRAGENLKIVNQTFASDVSYAGKVFKKIQTANNQDKKFIKQIK